MFVFLYMFLFRKIAVVYVAFSERNVIFEQDKDLFENRRNMTIRNSPAFSYTLHVLVRVLSNFLMAK